MVDRKLDELHGDGARAGRQPEPLPLVPTVNFRELSRGTPATLAKAVGVSRSAVSKAIRDGRIPGPGSDGLLDLRASIAAWIGNSHPGRVRARSLRPVAEEVAKLRAQVALLEAQAEQHARALAYERGRGRAIRNRLQDAAAFAVCRLADSLAAACARLAATHSAARLQAAADRGTLAWLIDREALRQQLYDLESAPHERLAAYEGEGARAARAESTSTGDEG